MQNYFDKLKAYVEANPPDYGDGESILTFLYEAYSESNRMDDARITEDFAELYRAMNGMSLKDMDRIVYPVCTLCRDHEKAGFVAGMKIGVLLQAELTAE